MLIPVYSDKDERIKRKAHIDKMKAQNNSNDCSKQMAMTAADRNWLMLDNMKKFAAKKGEKPLKGRPPKGQPKPRKSTGSKTPCKAIPKMAARKSTLATGRVKKPHNWRPRTIALWEIHHYQRSTDLLITMLPFERPGREIAQDVGHHNYQHKFQSTTIFALQEAAEAYLIQFLDNTNLCAIHAKCTTIQPKDIYLVQCMHKDYDPCWHWHH